MSRDLNFPQASESFKRLNPGLGLGVVGLPKTPVVKTRLIPESEVEDVGPCWFIIPCEPMGAPRQSRSDAWRPRPVVLRYREFKDKARACAPEGMTREPTEVRVVAFFPMPESWTKKKKAAMEGGFHRVKPDGDNVFKGCADALWEQDSCIAVSRVEKRWCRAGEERVEMEVLP